MTTANVSETIQNSSNVTGVCELCRSTGKIWPPEFGESAVAPRINHYIKAHGYRLLHVGTETTTGPDGDPWHTTVAVLAK